MNTAWTWAESLTLSTGLQLRTSHRRFLTHDTPRYTAPVLAFCRCMLVYTDGRTRRTSYNATIPGGYPRLSVDVRFWLHSMHTTSAGHGQESSMHHSSSISLRNIHHPTASHNLASAESSRAWSIA
jgi:hypothetical protein